VKLVDSKKDEQKKQIFSGELRKDLHIFQGIKDVKGNNTWVIFDPVADKYFRISEKEYIIVNQFYKNSALDEILERVKILDPDINKTHVLKVISFLRNSNLLQVSYKVTEHQLLKMRFLKQKTLPSKLMSSYLFFRIPLWNPDDFLNRTVDYIKIIFNKWMLLLFFIISICGYVSVVVHWQKFASTIISTLNYSGLIKYGITIIILKLFHEFAHAYSAKILGIRVRKFGIGFIIFFPRFYTDITDSWRLKSRRQRMLIDAAGIIIELLLGGVAALVWLNSGPGAVNTIAYFVFAVSIINTVLVNGNPFIRYDGYYLLMDFLNIDNLQRQGSAEIKKVVRRYFFGLYESVASAVTGGRKYFLIVYGISSFIYRIFLYTGIILIVYVKFTKAVGVVLVILEIYVLIIKPISMEIRQIMLIKNKIKKKNFIITSTFFIIIIIILFAPLPWIVTFPCIVDSDKTNVIYIKQAGFIDELLNKNNKLVKNNELLFIQKNPFLEQISVEKQLRLQINKVELDQLRSRVINKQSENGLIQKILNLENDLNENLRKLDLLNVKSPIGGIFVLFDWHLKNGKWVEHGEVIGEVYSTDEIVISAFVKEENINKVSIGDRVKFYIHKDIKPYYGKIIRINSVPSKIWKPSPLLSNSGGPIEVLGRENNYQYLLKNYYYQVTIQPESEYKDLKYSRTGIVQLRVYSSIGINFIRLVIRTIQKELTF